MKSRRWLLAFVAAIVAISTAVPAVAADDTPEDNTQLFGNRFQRFDIDVLSSRSQYASGGDARIAIDVPNHIDPDNVRVYMNWRRVTDSFTATADGDLEGVVEGMRDGHNFLFVSGGKGWGFRVGKQWIRNHPISGPMFSGPHQEPFICETEAAGLGPALDDDCFAETKVEMLYMSTAGAFAPLPDGPLPGDLAQTTTSLGETVDFIVRMETGVINRAIYQTAVLYDPAVEDTDAPDATPGWNGRLVYSYGGGCNAGFHQGQGNGGVLDAAQLGLGFGTASSSLNVLDNNCNHVSSAETTSMVKEHFIETYGDVIHTIGWGGSGGAISQHMIAQSYPGLLDGIVPTLSYPDASSIMSGIADCRAINNFVGNGGGATLDAADLTAISGHADWGNCLAWTFSFSNRFVVDEGCPPAIPTELLYDPVTNPDGVRCTVTDHNVNVIGVNPDTGVAYTMFDNVGVQYGLNALNDGQITVDEFLELNAGIGGYDTDGHFTAERTTAATKGLKRVYQRGMIQTGAGGLSTVPIIDFRPYLDQVNDIHVRFHSFSTRERLIESNGDAGNQVIQVAPDFVSWTLGLPQVLLKMDEWLTNLAGDNHITHADVVAAKPADLVDGCIDGSGAFVAEEATYDGPGTCNTLYPSHGDPRTAAGGPVISDVFKCQTTDLDSSSYSVEFTDDQWAQLETIFPNGVCDWTKNGVGQVDFTKTWRSYGR